MKHRSLCNVISGMLMLAAISALAQDARSPFPPAISVKEFEHRKITISPPEMIAPGQYRIGEILLNKAKKSVSFPATLNMNKNTGLLEYLLVRSSGKTYESVLRTDVEPYNLQLACLLVGMEGTTAPLAFHGDPGTPRGDTVEIELQVKGADGKPAAVAPEAWLEQVIDGAKRDVPPVHWVYTGSMVQDGRFAAQMDGSIVALYHDPVAMIDNASPGGETNRIWFVREDAMPPVGTPVMVTIRLKK